MDTREFLHKILPAEGIYYVGVMTPDRHGMQHRTYVTIDEMANFVIQAAGRQDITLYHACAAYRERFIETPTRTGMKKRLRVTENAAGAKAFWCDVDVGEAKAAEGKGYATKTDAGRAVLGYCNKHGIPAPMVVDSGNGMHFYWVLDEAVDTHTWQQVATQLKAVLAHGGVLADPTRTADIASVLRPVGTFNRKDPGNPKMVKVVREAAETTLDTMVAAISNVIANEGVEVAPVYERSAPLPPGLNDDLLAHAYPDIEVDGDQVVAKCQQMGFAVARGGNVGYEFWRGVIGIAVHCVDGHAKAHTWSSGSPGYSERETDSKYDSWNAGPTTCDFFEANNRGGCEGCAFKGKIKSPIVLGRQEPEPADAGIKEVEVEGALLVAETPAEVRGFKYDDATDQMVRYMTNKDGVLEVFPFSRFHIYPTTRICQADGTFLVRMRMHMPKKVLREFDMSTHYVAVGGQELMKELGRYEFMVTDNKDAQVHLTAYMRNALNKLVQTTEQMNTMTAFGWKDNMRSFLVGDRLYKNDGTTHKVMLGGAAQSKAAAYPAPIGTPEGWSAGVDYLYNRQGMVAMQYALCSGFGSILTPFGAGVGESHYKGIPVALTSTGSGKGKTTVARAALFAFGDADALTVNGNQGMTTNARSGLMGVHNNLPMLVDEITSIKGDELSALLYASSNGRDRDRMVSKQGQGVVLADTQTWALSMYLTANTHLSQLLASMQANTMAQAVRFFEIKYDTYPPPELDMIEVGVANGKIARNRGSAGEKFIQWCVSHVDEIETRFIKMTKEIVEDSDFAGHAAYRYYRQHAVCTLVAADIMRELDLVGFDLPALKEFTLAHIDRMCRDAKENNEVTSEDALNQMLNALAPRIITTRECRDLRFDIRGPEPFQRVHGEIIGRYIMGDALGKEPLSGHLYVVRKEIRDWCLKNRVDYDTMIADAKGRGWIIGDDEKFYLGRGTEVTSTQMRCVAFNMAAMQGAPAAPKVQLHAVISGEKEA